MAGHLNSFQCQGTVVLRVNTRFVKSISSEGRKIESRRQLERLAIVALRSKRKVEELKTKQAHARERPFDAWAGARTDSI